MDFLCKFAPDAVLSTIHHLLSTITISMSSIEVKGLSKQYGSQKAIDGISFSLEKGEIVGFLGPNGAGKSTTMKILAGCLKAGSGKAFINGIDVSEDPVASKRITGYLPESNPLYADMYIREYLSFIADIHQIADKKKAVEEIIDTVKLLPEAGKKIGQLSKGYKQRVGLAAALIHQPDVLILDEPTTGLDPNQIVEIREVIREYGRKRAVLFSTHILQEVEAICDRVLIIHQGKIITDNSLRNLQRQQQQNIVRVVLGESVEERVWKEIPALHSFRKTGELEWELEGDDPEKIKKQLLALSLQNNWNLVSLQSENRSLEDIFRGLTKSPNHE